MSRDGAEFKNFTCRNQQIYLLFNVKMRMGDVV